MANCADCGGVWLTSMSLERIVSSLKERHMALDAAEALATKATAEVNTSRSGIPCPVCDEPMYHVQYERVVVDRCYEHGTWFDRDELGRATTTMHEAADRLRTEDRDRQVVSDLGVMELIWVLFGIFG